MLPFEKCPACGGELRAKEVEKLLRGGNHMATVNVIAEVCRHCGERLYSQETIKRFEHIRNKLALQATSEFEPMGQSFEVR